MTVDRYPWTSDHNPTWTCCFVEDDLVIFWHQSVVVSQRVENHLYLPTTKGWLLEGSVPLLHGNACPGFLLCTRIKVLHWSFKDSSQFLWKSMTSWHYWNVASQLSWHWIWKLEALWCQMQGLSWVLGLQYKFQGKVVTRGQADQRILLFGWWASPGGYPGGYPGDVPLHLCNFSPWHLCAHKSKSDFLKLIFSKADRSGRFQLIILNERFKRWKRWKYGRKINWRRCLII